MKMTVTRTKLISILQLLTRWFTSFVTPGYINRCVMRARLFLAAMCLDIESLWHTFKILRVLSSS